MNWKKFSWANNALGWLVFAIASLVYLLTIEPTASLWDCAEFIACDYRLEPGHPPGAPFYMLVYNLATNLAPDVTQVALFANATSAIISGLTILFLFWTLTHMLRRLIVPEFRSPSGSARLEPSPISLAQSVIILGAALVGSLVYTFSDTFWFSAVEAEVYAFSSLFTAVVFWLMFQWEERSERLSSDRWLILIAYLMGLSIGVHLLNLLCLPAMALIYYYRRSQRPTLWGSVVAVFVSFVLIFVMMYGIVQGFPKMAGRFDYFFVNTLGLGFNSGLFACLLLTLVVLAYSAYEAHRLFSQGKPMSLGLKLSMWLGVVLMGIPFLGDGLGIGLALSVALGIYLFLVGSKLSLRFVHIMQASLLAILVGISSYGVILVRAVADTPMNENAPADAFSLRYYLAREQYGSAPLVYGPSFASQPIGLTTDKEIIGKAPRLSAESLDAYVRRSEQPKYTYRDADQMLFPRLYSRPHKASYNSWIGRSEQDNTPPTFGDNLTYFFRYQVNYMYWRYFLWNFVGRQNDIQGHGGLLAGNAITGIGFIDEWLVGPQIDMPNSLATNKGRNVYYALPFLLGLLGMLVQGATQGRVRTKDGKVGISLGQQSFWITFALFFMTGLAILLYLNQTPGQPRERDYAYAGSFYAYAIWIGIGVVGLWQLFKRTKLDETVSAGLAVLLGLIVPLQMAGQNWDDHDRSGRTVARDMGINYLESVEPNAILFCYGDNDTFPLWYAQDVEGIRRDVRTVNLSYLGGDWYIDQMRRKVYDADPVPMKYMKPEFYYFNEIAYVNKDKGDKSSDFTSLDEALAKVTSSQATGRDLLFPTDKVYITADVDKVMAKVEPDMKGYVKERINVYLDKPYLDRSSLAVLDIINANNWERPIYWTSTSPKFADGSLNTFKTGMAEQLLPVSDYMREDAKGKYEPYIGRGSVPPNIRVDAMYDNVMNKFRYGGADQPGVYMDETARNMLEGMRSSVFATLARELIWRDREGDLEKAQAVLRRCLEKIRPESVPYTYFSLPFVNALYEAKLIKEGDEVAEQILVEALKTAEWMLRLGEDKIKQVVADNSLLEQIRIATLAFETSREATYEYSEGGEEKASNMALSKYEPRLSGIYKALTGQPYQYREKSFDESLGDNPYQD